MSKHGRVSAFLETLESRTATDFHPCYAGYFECFNAGDYYEAHDVLEHLWLDCRDADRSFYQGLIQIAGAFVHLKKQHARPWHPTDGQRLGPAVRLFCLGERRLAEFGPRHLGLDVEGVLGLCREWRGAVEESDFRTNPWRPDTAPRLEPPR
jgi:predicted metal-dependent hydrolase